MSPTKEPKMTTTRPTNKVVYKANYGGATPEQVARALKAPRPKMQAKSGRKAKQTDG